MFKRITLLPTFTLGGLCLSCFTNGVTLASIEYSQSPSNDHFLERSFAEFNKSPINQSTGGLLKPEKYKENNFVARIDNQNSTKLNKRKSPDNTLGTIPSSMDLWDRLRRGYQLGTYSHPRISRELRWYKKRPAYINRTTERARPYLHFILNTIEQKNMPSEIALLPIIESAYQPFAYSEGRASGIWQFIPATGKRFGLKQNWWYDGRRDIDTSTHAALTYLDKLHRLFDGDWLLALAAYNAGEGKVRKAIRRNKRLGKPIDFWSLKLPRETRDYVPRLLAISKIIFNPQRFQIELPFIADQPFLAKVKTYSQIDLASAAKMAGLTMEKLYHYNPGYNQWATDPDGPHQLLVPVNKESKFKKAIKQLPKDQRITWRRHQIEYGETLSHIAIKYKTPVKTIKKINGLRDHKIRTGRHLLVPSASLSLSKYTFSAPQRKNKKQKTKKQGLKISYIVRRGDTLWDISRQYNVSMRQIASWNDMSTRDKLKPGDLLVIWWTMPNQNRDNLFGLSAKVPRLKQINYTVKKGDSLSRISKRYKVSILNLKKWNAISPQHFLQPGQKLLIFVDITQQTETI